MIRQLTKLAVSNLEQIGGKLEDRRGNALLPGDGGGNVDVLVDERETERAREGSIQYALGKQVHRRVRPSARGIDHVEGHGGLYPFLHQSDERLASRPDMNGEERLVHRLRGVGG